MKREKTYNIFLFLSTFTRGLVEVYSLVLLYKKGYSLDNLLFFLFLMYFIGILVNYISLKLHYKKVLVISSLIYGLSFIYLSLMNTSLISLSILALLLAFGNYSFHANRHLLALTMLDTKKRKTSSLVTINYLGSISATIMGMYLINKLSLTITSIILFILSFISIFPILKQPSIDVIKYTSDSKVNISKSKIIFNILEQFKVVFLELQPLFLYIYIDKSIYYVGIFNVITNIASLMVIYFISKKLTKYHFKYYALALGLIFILKLNIKSSLVLLLIAFLEGIFVKIYETFSLDNLYHYNDNCISKYLIIEEIIFFASKSFIILLFLLFNFSIYTIMYINIVGIIISGFFLKDSLG